MPSLTREDLQTVFEYSDTPVMLMDGFEPAFIGVSFKFGCGHVATYDYSKCVEILMERDDMRYSEAEEYMEFNVIGTGGEGSPVFVDRTGFEEIEYKPKSKFAKMMQMARRITK